jgi:hypothetical protein
LSEEWHALRPARPASPTDEAATSRDGDDDDDLVEGDGDVPMEV